MVKASTTTTPTAQGTDRIRIGISGKLNIWD
jgi:hypothetical protein